jgi:hypothetical protein
MTRLERIARSQRRLMLSSIAFTAVSITALVGVTIAFL